MPRFRKKFADVEAILWTGYNYEDVWQWAGDHGCTIFRGPRPYSLILAAKGGDYIVEPNHYIVKLDGNHSPFAYPAKYFEADYEPVEEDL